MNRFQIWAIALLSALAMSTVTMKLVPYMEPEATRVAYFAAQDRVLFELVTILFFTTLLTTVLGSILQMYVDDARTENEK